MQKLNTILIALLIIISSQTLYAIKPQRILVVANSDIKASMEIARYYCSKRNVPKGNIIALSLGSKLSDQISREDYDKLLAEPIRQKLCSSGFIGETNCVLTIFGVPYKVAARGVLPGQQDKLAELRQLKAEAEKSLNQLEGSKAAVTPAQKEAVRRQIETIRMNIDRIEGKDTHASVDSELSMVLFDNYELYWWQQNDLNGPGAAFDFRTVMVSRLDGPSKDIAKGIVDKALLAEKNGLKGKVYIDTGYSAQRNNERMFIRYDLSMEDAGNILKSMAGMSLTVEKTTKLFEPGSCPDTAVYCGWYSLGKYVDAFDFVPGAIGYHIASLEAVNLHDPNSNQWCPAMLADGVTVTIGAVAEPYLSAFPDPKDFFLQLLEGKCLVEAYYSTNPYNSWQMLLIGDPLYQPFKKP